jgi:predicted double-glycine peptidase
VNDQNKSSVPHLYSENAYEHIRNVRKALKKRRVLADEGLQNPQTKITPNKAFYLTLFQILTWLHNKKTRCRAHSNNNQ